MSSKSKFLKFTNRIKNSFKEKFPRLNADTGYFAQSANGSDEAPMIGKSSPSDDIPTFARFPDLPREIQSRIGVHAVLAHTDGLLDGVETLRQVSHPLVNYLAAGPALTRIERVELEEPAALVNYVHEKTYPRNGLPEYRFALVDGDRPLCASDHVENAMENWKFLSEDAKTQVLGDVGKISGIKQRLACIHEISRHSDILEPIHGRVAAREAIEIFGAVAGSSENLDATDAATRVVYLRKHVGPEEVSRLDEIFLEHPHCRAIFHHQMVAIEQGSHYPHADFEPLKSGKPLTLKQLRQAIDKHLEDDSLSELKKNDRIYSALSHIPNAIQGSLAEIRTELSESHAPSGIGRSGSQARADLSGTRRARSDHAR